jgi:hypothetical protein
MRHAALGLVLRVLLGLRHLILSLLIRHSRHKRLQVPHGVLV